MAERFFSLPNVFLKEEDNMICERKACIGETVNETDSLCERCECLMQEAREVQADLEKKHGVD